MNQEYPSLNGITPSWADLKVVFNIEDGPSLNMVDIAGIKTETSLDIGEQKGLSGGRVLKRTTGEGKQSASMTLFRDGIIALYRALVARAPTRGNQAIVGVVSFNIVYEHTPPGSVEVYRTEIRGCRFAGRSHDLKEGTDADQLEVPLHVIEIVDFIDGKEVVLI